MCTHSLRRRELSQAITVTNLVGRSVTIQNDGVQNVNDALAYFYANSAKPSKMAVSVGGSEVPTSQFGSHQIRGGDVVVVREGEMASKRSISGA